MKSVIAIKSQAWTLLEKTNDPNRKIIISNIADRYIANIRKATTGKDFAMLIAIPKEQYMQ